jgi:hypothetical protein
LTPQAVRSPPACLAEAHLRQILSSYGAYYNEARTHLSLSKDAPVGTRFQFRHASRSPLFIAAKE